MFVYALLNMDDLTKHRKDRLRALIEGKPYAGNQAEFGRKAGLTKARITQLLNPDEPFGERAAESLCAKLELSPRWFEQGLATGEGEMLAAGGRTEASNVIPASIGTRRVPLISYVQAGCWTEASDAATVGDGFEYLLTDLELSGSAFALEIQGESMLPEFRPGDRVIVDPEIQPQPGDCVVAMNGGQEATFKKYRPRGIDERGDTVFELVPLNEDFAPMRSDQTPIRIVGTMMEHRKYRRRA